MIGQLRPLESRIKRDRLRKPVSSLPHIRVQLQESKSVQKAIRDVLVPRRGLQSLEEQERQRCSRRSRLPEIVDRQKERLRIKIGIETRKEVMTNRKKELKWMNEVTDKWDQTVVKKYSEFEQMCRNKNDAASKALVEAEHWTRKRAKLSMPIVKLDRSIRSIRADLTELENRFENLSEYKHFIILFVHNSTNSLNRPLTMERFFKLPNQSEIINSIALEENANGKYAIKEHRTFTNTIERESRLEEFSPNDIEYELEEMESRSLRLIENWQTSADELSDARYRQHSTIVKLNNQISDIKSQCNMYRAEIDRFTERSTELELYCGMFVEGVENGLFTGDETLKEYQRKITRLYNQVTDNSTMKIEVETLVMLTAVETRLMDLIMDEEQLDATKVRDAQREIERRRKTELYEQKNQDAETLRLARNLKALERSNQTQKIKTGRRLMKRSKPFSIKKETMKELSELNCKHDQGEDESFYFSFH